MRSPRDSSPASRGRVGTSQGRAHLDAELSGKRLELLKAAMPSLSRVAVLRCPVVDGPPNLIDGPQWREMQAAARTLGVQLAIPGGAQVLTTSRAPLPRQLQDRARGVCDVGLPYLSRRIQGRQRVVDLAAKSRLPGMHPSQELCRGWGPYVLWGEHAWTAVAGAAAVFVDKILKGAAARGLPVERPSQFALVLNRKTAQALGLTIPSSLLFQADKVIQ